nr:hypothetical protein [Tanacetum cinerariifolium]
MGDDVDINTLTMEQHTAFIQDNIRPGIEKPKFDCDIKFEINGNFMSLEMENRLFTGLITTWDLLEKVLMSQYCPPFKTAMQLERIRNFKHEMDETLYYAADDEWIKKFIENTDSNIKALKTTTKNLQEKADQLTQTTLINSSERVKAKTKMGKKDMGEPVPRDLLVVQPYVPPTPFQGHLKKQKDNPYKTHETIGIPKKIHIKKAQEDEGDMDDGWDITIKNIERLRQILIPTIHTLPNLEPVDLNSKETEFEIISTHNHMV